MQENMIHGYMSVITDISPQLLKNIVFVTQNYKFLPPDESVCKI
jgi:hypothetical protein